MNYYNEQEVGLRRAAMSRSTVFQDSDDQAAVEDAADALQDAGRLRDRADAVVRVFADLPPMTGNDKDESKVLDWVSSMALRVGALEKR